MLNWTHLQRIRSLFDCVKDTDADAAGQCDRNDWLNKLMSLVNSTNWCQTMPLHIACTQIKYK